VLLAQTIEGLKWLTDTAQGLGLLATLFLASALGFWRFAVWVGKKVDKLFDTGVAFVVNSGETQKKQAELMEVGNKRLDAIERLVISQTAVTGDVRVHWDNRLSKIEQVSVEGAHSAAEARRLAQEIRDKLEREDDDR
jgi:hypothetical protein